jgi:phosphoglycolate phosphatase-like HAD superfamily hydrolase
MVVVVGTQALKDMKVMPGVAELATLLDSVGVPRALVTRNVLKSVHHFHSEVFQERAPFSPALARCFRPYKPYPDSILHVCETWNISPENCVMIGDSAKDDIVCGKRAGSHTILIDVLKSVDRERLPDEQQPSFHVHSMHDVAQVLQNHFTHKAPTADAAALNV